MRSDHAIHKALGFRIAILKGKLFVLLTPEIVAQTGEGELAERDPTKALRSAIYGYQHNDVYDSDLKGWTSRITEVDIPDAWQPFSVTLEGTTLECAKNIGRTICAALDKIRAIKPSAITLVYVPLTWAL